MNDPYWERRQDDAEARMRARMARVEREHAARRKRYATAAVIALAFVVSLVYGLVAHALRTRSTAAEVATRPAPAPAAAPEPTPPAEAPAAPAPAAEPDPVPAPKPAPAPAPKPKPARVERVRIDIGSVGYEPSEVRVPAGARLTITVGKGEGCAAGFLMPDLGIAKDNSGGPVTFTVGPLKAGTYRFTCGMEMVEGRIIAG